MVKRSSFSLKYSGKALMLLTDLKGNIVHVSGNTALLNSTHRNLFYKNIFSDLMTEESRRLVSEELNSCEILPQWIDYRVFTISYSVKNKKSKRKIETKQLKTRCYRTFVKFSQQLVKRAEVHEYTKKSDFEFPAEKQYEIREMIMVTLEPCENKKPCICEEQSVELSGESKQDSAKLSNEKVKIKKDLEQISPVFETPKKDKKQNEFSTCKIEEDG